MNLLSACLLSSSPLINSQCWFRQGFRHFQTLAIFFPCRYHSLSLQNIEDAGGTIPLARMVQEAIHYLRQLLLKLIFDVPIRKDHQVSKTNRTSRHTFHSLSICCIYVALSHICTYFSASSNFTVFFHLPSTTPKRIDFVWKKSSTRKLSLHHVNKICNSKQDITYFYILTLH